MLYAILCYNDEAEVGAWTREEDDACMARLAAVKDRLARAGRLGPVARLLPTTAATTLRKSRDELVLDGPFAETKEQLLGFYVVDCADLEAAIATARELARANPGTGCYELRPIGLHPRRPRAVTEAAWIASALIAARAQALAALLRRFRNLDTAEEAFQEACLRALKTWPTNGPPRDPAAWLIMVGRNALFDQERRLRWETELPDEAALSDADDAETRLVARLDAADCADDVLRLLFVCGHPDLPATQQIALALRVVSGLSVRQIARAFLVGEAAMEQRITRAKARVAESDIPYSVPGALERAERLAAVAAMLYLLFNEGYSGIDGKAAAKSPLCGEAIRLARLLLRLFPAEPEIMGLLALMLLQHSRAAARFDRDGEVVLLEDQDRTLWDRRAIAEGLALVDKALRHRRPGAFQIQAALAGLHARAARPADTDWEQMDLLYAALETVQPSPVVRLNHAVAVAKLKGPEAALAMIEPLAPRLARYYPFHGVRGAFLLEIGRRDEARTAFNCAIALAGSTAEAGHIRRHLDGLMRERETAEKTVCGDVGLASPPSSS